MTYKGISIFRVQHNGYYYALTNSGRVMADTIKGIKSLIDKGL